MRLLKLLTYCMLASVLFVSSCKKMKTKKLITPYVGKWVAFYYDASTIYSTPTCIYSNNPHYIIEIYENGKVKTLDTQSNSYVFEGYVRIKLLENNRLLWSLYKNGLHFKKDPSQFFVSITDTYVSTWCLPQNKEYTIFRTFQYNNDFKSEDFYFFWGTRELPLYHFYKIQ